MLGFLIFFSLVGVVVFSILCVFASLTVKLIKKHNRASSNTSSNNGWLVAPPLISLGLTLNTQLQGTELSNKHK